MRFLIFVLCVMHIGFAGVKEQWIHSIDRPVVPYEEHLLRAKQAMECSQLKTAKEHLAVILDHCKEQAIKQEGYYVLGNLYYSIRDYDSANECYSKYLEHPNQLEDVNNVFQRKYDIALLFAHGKAKVRPLGSKILPRVGSGQAKAMEILDEIITTLPASELAAKAYLARGYLYKSQHDWDNSIAELEKLIRYCSFSEVARDAYLALGDLYYERVLLGEYTEDNMHFAQRNKEQFLTMFPADPNILLLENNLSKMEEQYALALYNRALFYKKKKQPQSVEMYFKLIQKKYPNTEVASIIRKKQPCVP